MLTYTLTITLTCNIYTLILININICILILTLIKLINKINGLISCLVSRRQCILSTTHVPLAPADLSLKFDLSNWGFLGFNKQDFFNKNVYTLRQ